MGCIYYALLHAFMIIGISHSSARRPTYKDSQLTGRLYNGTGRSNSYRDSARGSNYDNYGPKPVECVCPPPTSSPATAAPAPSAYPTDISANSLTVKEIRLGQWLIRDEECDEDGQRCLVFRDATGSDEDRLALKEGLGSSTFEGQGKLKLHAVDLNDLQIGKDWKLYQDDSSGALWIQDRVTAGLHRIAINRGIGSTINFNPAVLTNGAGQLQVTEIQFERKWLFHHGPYPAAGPEYFVLRDYDAYLNGRQDYRYAYKEKTNQNFYT
ncbi:uncharacterized protein LOC129597842 [Paramacrobiotus metropolitanus]|uniref:uncharacterized protein LOC129597842 n=1 Tax=Paramacrobiotus metropolitanus TaxID=2943436 RepID=UPI002445DC2E|nr:uncharacterized protein LOC129597842 [Paramacrobiotus metropolitanus]